MRPDKVTLAALAATLGLYRAGRATTEIPVWRMIAATPEDLGRRADAVLAALPGAVRDRGRGHRAGLDGRRRLAARRDARRRSGWSSSGRRADRPGGRLRAGDPPVVGRIEDGAVLLDLRTVEPSDDAALGRRWPARSRRAAAPRPMTVVVGTAGHIDHGKTTLLRALTGIDADRLPEERRRGMTIDVGYAHLTLPDGTELDFVDVPGHDRLVGNMLVGAGEIDAAMLVVAADDGPRAQTIEHLALLDALGIRHGLAVVTKADVAGPGADGRGGRRGRALLAGRRSPVRRSWRSSSVDGDGIDARARGARATCAIGSLAIARGARGCAAGSRLAIDRVFAVKGRGAVVTGTLRGATAGPGATLRLVPGDRSVRVREVQVHGATVETADPGRTALNLAGVDDRRPASRRGPDRRPGGRRERPAPRPARRALPGPGARAASTSGPRPSDASVGRSGRDALDLPDGRRGDPPAGGAARGRAGRPVRPARGPPAPIGSSAAWSSMSRRRAGSRAGARPPSGSGASPTRSQAGDADGLRRRPPRPPRRARADRRGRRPGPDRRPTSPRASTRRSGRRRPMPPTASRR